MKKILVIICLLILILGLPKNSHKSTFEDFKRITHNNIKKIPENINLENNEYKNNRYYKRIKEKGLKSVVALTELYKENSLDDSDKTIASLLIQDITNCNLKAEYDLEIDSPDDFFELWKNNNCHLKEKLEKERALIYEPWESYPDFTRLIKECQINVPILKDMVPQGITLMKEYILVSAYNDTGEHNSKVYTLNQKGEVINITTLDTESHVGSISYDTDNNLIWIPGKDGELHAYNPSDFINKKETSYKYKFENLSDGLFNYQDKNKKHIAYLCVDDSYIYIGSFTRIEKGIIRKFKIIPDESEGIKLEYVNEFKVSSKNQGITFYNFNNEKYMLLSKSYGRHNSSHIVLYKYDETIKDYTRVKPIKFNLPPLLEQITISEKELYIIFESNAPKYNNCKDKVGSICTLNINDMIEELLQNEQLNNQNKKSKKGKRKEN